MAHFISLTQHMITKLQKDLCAATNKTESDADQLQVQKKCFIKVDTNQALGNYNHFLAEFVYMYQNCDHFYERLSEFIF